MKGIGKFICIAEYRGNPVHSAVHTGITDYLHSEWSLLLFAVIVLLFILACLGLRYVQGIDISEEDIEEKGEEDRHQSQYFFVIRELTAREIKRKYARSYLGIIWSVLNPLLTMAVMSLIFSTMFRRAIDNYPIYYLTGSIIWNLFSSATNAAMTALVDNKSLLLKSKLPKQTFVLSRVYTALVNFGYTFAAYICMLVVFHIQPVWTMLLFPIDVLLVLLFAAGISYFLSIAYVFFADIKYLYGILLTLWMYLSAIFYPADALPEIMQAVISFNPIYLSVYIARECVMYGRMPDYVVWIKLIAAAGLSFIFGFRFFRRKQNLVMQKL